MCTPLWHPAATVVFSASGAEYYLLDAGTKRWIKDAGVFNSWGYAFKFNDGTNKQVQVTDAELACYASGATIEENASIVAYFDGSDANKTKYLAVKFPGSANGTRYKVAKDTETQILSSWGQGVPTTGASAADLAKFQAYSDGGTARLRDGTVLTIQGQAVVNYYYVQGGQGRQFEAGLTPSSVGYPSQGVVSVSKSEGAVSDLYGPVLHKEDFFICGGPGSGNFPTSIDSCCTGMPYGTPCGKSKICDGIGHCSVNCAILEICGDGIDNNCDGITDVGEGGPNCQFFWQDDDGDGFGLTGPVCTCSATPVFGATAGGDCNDSNSNIYPGQTEVCNDQKDNDCDGTTDEGCPPPCVASNEICDGKDNNCNTLIDDGASCTDGLACTSDSCVGGSCQFTTTGGWCLINGACVSSGSFKPGTACSKCDSLVNASDWTPVDKSPPCCDTDADCLASTCNALSCQTCQCDKASHQCSSKPALEAGFCIVGGSCVAEGEDSPVDACATCQPEISTSSYTATEGEPCATIDLCSEKAGSCSCTAKDADGFCTTATCKAPPKDCDDEDPCTNDTCDPVNGCEHTDSSGVPCDDDNLCTTGDVCVSGICLGKDPTKCDDSNPCTDDTCDPVNGCTFWYNTSSCEDGNPATEGDVCSVGVCLSGKVAECQADVDCQKLDDSNPCNGKLICKLLDKVCITDPATIISCGPPAGVDAPCLAVSCNSATGKCEQSAVNEGSACDDGNPCTTGDACKTGKCLGPSPVSCNDNNPCTDDACEPAVGCVSTPNALPCDDNDLCTKGDICADSACASGQAIACDDKNGCTADSCDPISGCVFTPTSNQCNDGNACTKADTCQTKGLCQGDEVVCDDGNPCTADSCKPTTGCSFEAMVGACDDGDPCTNGDACKASVCQPGQFLCECLSDSDCQKKDTDKCDGLLYCNKVKIPYVCADQPGTKVVCDASLDTACQKSACNPATGACSLKPMSDGTSCDDKNACTENDACQAGECVGGKILACADSNPCTDDGCNPASGCQFTPNSLACNDGNACTVGDKCSGGICQSGPTLDCDDMNPCTTDSCDQGAGCKHVSNTVACSDNNACTVNDQCFAGACQSGPTANCNDQNQCTEDSCDPAAGCKYVNNTKPCDDGSACTTNDTCSAGSCKGGPAPDCNDTNACTVDSCDPGKGCQHVENLSLCDDLNPCTDDICDPAAGCENTPNSSSCDDGDPCTEKDLCLNGVCEGLASGCAWPERQVQVEYSNPAVGQLDYADLAGCTGVEFTGIVPVIQCTGGPWLQTALFGCYEENISKFTCATNLPVGHTLWHNVHFQPAQDMGGYFDSWAYGWKCNKAGTLAVTADGEQLVISPLPHDDDEGCNASVLIPAAEVPSVAGNFVSNPSFEVGMLNWFPEIHEWNSAKITLDCTNSVAGWCSAKLENLTLTNADGSSKQDYDVQLVQNGIQVVAGKSYVLSMFVRANAPRIIRIAVMKNSSPWNSWGLYKQILVNAVWQEFALTFTATGTDADAKLGIMVGDDLPTVWVDDVVLSTP